MKKITKKKPSYTDITFVLDRSGSMWTIWDDTIGGFNSFLNEQKKLPDKCHLTLVKFDHEYDFVYQNQEISTIDKLDRKTFVPRGNTALFDAIGRSIIETETRLLKLNKKERPNKVIFVIQTDGAENASKEYTREKIAELIKNHQKEHDWEFIFLGANQDAITSGQSMGFTKGQSLSYASNAHGTQSLYTSVNSLVSNIRSGSGPTYFTQSDRDTQYNYGAVNHDSKGI